MKTIYTNGQVFTGRLPLQEAFVVEDGRFLAVGTTQDMLVLQDKGDAVVSLEGRFVCPGFNDSHMHLLSYGHAMDKCDLTGAATASLTALQEALRAFIAVRQPKGDDWLLGRGWNQDYFTPATGIPVRQDLDAVCAGHPVCITRCCGHCLVVNTRALELLGIDENTPVPEGGAIERDGQGQLTGVFLDAAMTLVYARLPRPTKADLKRMLRNASAALNRVGVTSCQTDDLCAFENVPWQEVLEAYREVEREGGLTVRVFEQSQFTDVEHLRAFLDTGLTTGSGSDLFKIGPLKMLGDGSLGARTAYLSAAYADAPEEKGIAIFTQQQFNDMISLANEHGMSAAIHVIGDGILDRVLNAYEYAFARCPREDHRSGLVHVQLTRPDQLERIRAMNLHAHVQTIFIDYDSRIVHARAGETLANTSYAFRTLRQMGVHVSNGTDCPVENPHPMRGIQCAVTRQPLDGSLPPYRPEEAFTVEEALQIYTSEGAFASFEEDFKGQILPGMAADFVVLDANPFAVQAGDIHRIRTRQTFLGGRCVYAAKAD
ncbi:MAG: amidohydrolase [Aristaeellaceae bacterium]